MAGLSVSTFRGSPGPGGAGDEVMEKNRKADAEYPPADPRQRQPGGDSRENQKEHKGLERRPGEGRSGDGRDRSDRDAIDRPVQLDREKLNRPKDIPPAK